MSHPRPRRRFGARFFVHVGAFAVVFGTGVALAGAVQIDVRFRAAGVRPDGGSYVPTYRAVSGPQIVMAYIGSSQCAWSSDPTLPASVERIKVRLAQVADDRGLSFKAIGVAIDWSPALGVAHLSGFGLFDEISVGYNWGNTLAEHLFWSDLGVDPATPQVIIYQTFLVSPTDRGDAMVYGEGLRSLVRTLIGPEEIKNWSESERFVISTFE